MSFYDLASQLMDDSDRRIDENIIKINDHTDLIFEPAEDGGWYFVNYEADEVSQMFSSKKEALDHYPDKISWKAYASVNDSINEEKLPDAQKQILDKWGAAKSFKTSTYPGEENIVKLWMLNDGTSIHCPFAHVAFGAKGKTDEDYDIASEENQNLVEGVEDSGAIRLSISPKEKYATMLHQKKLTDAQVKSIADLSDKLGFNKITDALPDPEDYNKFEFKNSDELIWKLTASKREIELMTRAAMECVATNEETTMSSISYLPTQLGAVKAKLADLSQEKEDWGIEILEGDNDNEFKIENRVNYKVPKQHWDGFLKIFDGKLNGKILKLEKIKEGKRKVNPYLAELINFGGELRTRGSVILQLQKEGVEQKNIDAYMMGAKTVKKQEGEEVNEQQEIKEAMDDVMKKLRYKLKRSLESLLNNKEFIQLSDVANAWTRIFGIQSYKTDVNKVIVISDENSTKDIQRIYGKLLRAYGDDKGNLEMIIGAIDKKEALNSFDVFKYYDYVFGTRIESEYYGIKLVFEATIDFLYDESQSIYVNGSVDVAKPDEPSKDETPGAIEGGKTAETVGIIDAIEDAKIANIKIVGQTIWPVGGKFTSPMLHQIHDAVKDAI